MVIARASAAPRTLGRVAFRRAGAQSRPQAWRQIGRRNYAAQGHQAKSSDIPWLIGSIAVTVPAAAWLLGQAPKKSDHGHHEEHEEHEDKAESKDESKAEESSEEKSDDGDKDDKKDDKDTDAEKKDEGKDDKSDSDDSKKDSSDDSSDKDSGDDEKGDGKSKRESGKGAGETELKGEKMSKKDESGAKNPHLDNVDEKSKKGEGVADTAKIHGTVDPKRPSRGDGEEK